MHVYGSDLCTGTCAVCVRPVAGRLRCFVGVVSASVCSGVRGACTRSSPAKQRSFPRKLAFPCTWLDVYIL